jgi:hypothetical protein
VAIHATVLYSPDRHYRITADAAGTTITVERDLVLVRRFTNLAALERFLSELHLTFADLIND